MNTTSEWKPKLVVQDTDKIARERIHVLKLKNINMKSKKYEQN